MSTIQSLGIGSGFDINTIIDELVKAERDPKVEELDEKEATLDAQISAFGTLKSSLASVESKLTDLQLASTFNARDASSSDSTILTATASSVADIRSYAIEVEQLAQAHTLVTAGFTSKQDVIGTGTITLDFGTTVYDSESDTPYAFARARL